MDTENDSNCFWIELYITPEECDKLTKTYTTQVYFYLPNDYPFSPPTIMLEHSLKHPLVNVSNDPVKEKILSDIMNVSDSIISDILEFFGDTAIIRSNYIPSDKLLNILSTNPNLCKEVNDILQKLLNFIVLNGDRSLNVDKSKDRLISCMKRILRIKDDEDIETVNVSMSTYSILDTLSKLISNVYRIIIESLHDERNQYLL